MGRRGDGRLLEEMNWICLRCGGVRAARAWLDYWLRKVGRVGVSYSLEFDLEARRLVW